jgi:transcriptional regulator with XRE-family HTH domain
VAARADVNQSMISIYERGRRDPSWSTFRRLVHGAGAAAEVRLEPLPLGRADAFTVAELGHQLHDTTDRRRRRLVLEFVGRFAATESTRRVALLLDEPAPVGDPRWDALLGALAEHLAFHEAVDPPEWCTGASRFLDHPWYWIDLPSVRRMAQLGAPTAFRRRNVWVDRSDLERV